MLQNRPIMLCGNSLEIALLCLGLVLFCSHGSCLCSHYAHAYYTIHIRSPLIDCLFPVRCPRLLLPAASLPFFSQVGHIMPMRKSIKRFVTVLPCSIIQDDLCCSGLVLSNVTFRYDIGSQRLEELRGF